ETRAALDLIFHDHFSPHERGIFGPIKETLMTRGDYFMHLADLTSYVKMQATAGQLFTQPDEWARKAILNVAASGKFSSDRSVREYVENIWRSGPCPAE
ncbi:MAG: glycogen/starch/alpha-glucan phosphorylase, partial [Gemmataceae bacterium]